MLGLFVGLEKVSFINRVWRVLCLEELKKIIVYMCCLFKMEKFVEGTVICGFLLVYVYVCLFKNLGRR